MGPQKPDGIEATLNALKVATDRAKVNRKKLDLRKCLKECERAKLTSNRAYLEARSLLAELTAEDKAKAKEKIVLEKATGSKKSVNGVLHPQSQFVQKWDLAMLWLMAFTATVTPYEIGFLETKIDTLFFLNRIADIGFVTDIFIQFRLGFFDRENLKFEMRKQQIAKRYFQSWFAIDAVSTVPYDVIALFLGGGEEGGDGGGDNLSQLKILRILKLLKMVKMLRVLKSARILKRLVAAAGLSNATTQLLKFLLIIMALLHWTACVWRILPDIEANPEGSWMTENGSCQMEGLPPDIIYLYTFEFALKVMAMSYNNCAPATNFELGFAVFLTMIAGSMYGYVIGGICGILSDLDPVTQEYRDTMDLMKMYMAELRAPIELRFRVRGYFEHCKNLFRDRIFKDTILSKLTPVLREKVAVHQYEHCLSKVHFFNVEDVTERNRFIAGVSSRLSLKAFPPQEIIIQEGAPARALGIVLRGVVRLKQQLITKDYYFAEEFITTDSTYLASAAAMTYVDVAMLSRNQLFGLLSSGVRGNLYPQTSAKIRKAQIRMALKRVVREVGKGIVVLKKIEFENDYPNKRYKRMSPELIERYKLMLMTKVRQQQVVDAQAKLQLEDGAAPDKKKNRRKSGLVSYSDEKSKQDGGKSDRTKMAKWVVSFWTSRNVDGLRLVEADGDAKVEKGNPTAVSPKGLGAEPPAEAEPDAKPDVVSENVELEMSKMSYEQFGDRKFEMEDAGLPLPFFENQTNYIRNSVFNRPKSSAEGTRDAITEKEKRIAKVAADVQDHVDDKFQVIEERLSAQMDKGLSKFAKEMRALRESIAEEMEKNEALASVVNG
jgi:hypothetical protein